MLLVVTTRNRACDAEKSKHFRVVSAPSVTDVRPQAHPMRWKDALRRASRGDRVRQLYGRS